MDTAPKTNMCWGLNSHCFPIVGMVINHIVGVYIPIIRIPIKGGMTIPRRSEDREEVFPLQTLTG